jgi:tetratricopeptide (TPR) repeat protein
MSLASAQLTAQIERAASLLDSDPAAAARAADVALRMAPRDPRAQLIRASAHRRLGETAPALAILAPLARAFPRAAQTQYELGLVLCARGDETAGQAALRQAVALKPDLAEGWKALGERLFAAGDDAGARAAFARHDRAMVRDAALGPAADALYGGRVEEAEARLKAHLSARPDDAAALRLMAEVLARLERWADAEVLLAHALAREPDHDGARFAYANALFQQQKAAEALTEIEALLAIDPAEPAYLNLLAACLDLVGDFPRVLAIQQDLLSRFPRQPRIWLNHGHALRTVGRRDDAIGAYRRAIMLNPGLGDAYWSLANLKVAAITPAEQAAMTAQLAHGDLSVDDRLHLLYALGKALEDRGDHAGAFARYAEGAALRRASNGYRPEIEAALARDTMALFDHEFLEARRGWGAPDDDPIFIVGLPRSGSTLIEQILASHSAVEGVAELPDIAIIATQLNGPHGDYPACLEGLSAEAARALGKLYLDRTRIHRQRGRKHFIDKMPNNFRHVGLIQLILPNARIIDARRHPLGACFSAFKQHFAQGQAFTYDLGDLGAYYRDYVAVMDHFDRVLPGRVHRVIYEDLVEDAETEIRRLLAHCGLDFEDACLRFHETERAVRTVSSEQVRRPIYRDGLDQWRAFEPWLEPLKTALGPALGGWRGDGALTGPGAR